MSSPSIKLIPTGAILQEFLVGSKPRNIVLGFNTASEYTANPCHFGATIGRVANRIKDAKITDLGGNSWVLAANNGVNNLHGGERGWGKQEWNGPTPVNVDGKECVVFTYTSPHLDEGFPGEVEVKVRYDATEEDGKVSVGMEYEARLVGEAEEAVVNITNHSYFNLSDLPTIEGTQAILGTNLHLPLDAGGIPLDDSAAPYPGIEANVPFTLGKEEPDVDDCFVFPDAIADPSSVPIDTRGLPLRTCAKFYHPDSGVHLEVASTEPAFQFYTGKYVDVEERGDGTERRVPRAGFCVEPSRFVDAVNREWWKGMVVLRKGMVYGSRIVFTAWEGDSA
ncbi:bifunctional protein GAL10 [Wilcoxina mikolae CBS 423.85]|nr:bifunctional protein GAL10 [Wilcoxina mikolae CBS 423.85]